MTSKLITAYILAGFAIYVFEWASGDPFKLSDILSFWVIISIAGPIIIPGFLSRSLYPLLELLTKKGRQYIWKNYCNLYNFFANDKNAIDNFQPQDVKQKNIVIFLSVSILLSLLSFSVAALGAAAWLKLAH